MIIDELKNILNKEPDRTTLVVLGVCAPAVCRQVLDYLSVQPNDKVTVVSLDERNDAVVISAPLKPKLISDYVDKARDYFDMEVDSFNLAKQWYKPDGRDLTLVDGLSYGSLVEWEMTYFFAALLRAKLETEKILASVQPEQVIYIRDAVPDAQSILIGPREDLHARFFAAQDELVVPLSRPSSRSMVLGWVKGLIKRGVLLASSALNQVARFKAKRAEANVLVTGLHYLGIPLLKLMTRAGTRNVFVLTSEYTFPLRKNVWALSQSSSLRKHEDVNLAGSISSNMFSALRDRDLKRDLKVADMGDRIDHLVKSKFPALARQVSGWQALFNEYKIKVIVLPNDVLEREKLIVSIAAKQGIKSLVVLHGMVGEERAPVGFIPLSADRIVVWGEDSADKLSRMGIDKERISVLGCPRFDVHIRRAASSDRSHGMSVLVAGNTYARETSYPNLHVNLGQIKDFYNIVVEAAKQMPERRFVVKCRSKNDRRFVFRMLKGRLPDNVKLVHRDDLTELLVDSAVLVTGWSTVALEAMMMGRPIIAIKHKGLNEVLSYDKCGVALPVYDHHELAEAIKILLSDSSVKDDLADAREKYLERSFGALDGQASRRVADLVNNMIGGKVK